MSLTELKKALKEKTISFGTQNTIKRLKNKDVKKVFLASNCPDDVKDTIKRYAKMNKVDIVNLKQPNDEIGLTCKKQFGISVLCY